MPGRDERLSALVPEVADRVLARLAGASLVRATSRSFRRLTKAAGSSIRAPSVSTAWL